MIFPPGLPFHVCDWFFPSGCPDGKWQIWSSYDISSLYGELQELQYTKTSDVSKLSCRCTLRKKCCKEVEPPHLLEFQHFPLYQMQDGQFKSVQYVDKLQLNSILLGWLNILFQNGENCDLSELLMSSLRLILG